MVKGPSARMAPALSTLEGSRREFIVRRPARLVGCITTFGGGSQKKPGSERKSIAVLLYFWRPFVA